jgi:hypothetical protein
LDPETKEILSRQNAELSKELGHTSSSLPQIHSAPTNLGSLPPHALAPEMEAQARQILRQQEAANTTAPNVRSAPSSSSASVAAAAVPAAQAQNQIPYSREAEARARQELLNQPQASTSPQASANNSITPPQTNLSPAATPAPAGGATDAELAAIHAKALDTMEHVLNPSPKERSNEILSAKMPKREKLHELTDLYKADKLTPAEYHAYRAKIIAQPE